VFSARFVEKTERGGGAFGSRAEPDKYDAIPLRAGSWLRLKGGSAQDDNAITTLQTALFRAVLNFVFLLAPLYLPTVDQSFNSAGWPFFTTVEYTFTNPL
jgi:hypothetical protein